MEIPLFSGKRHLKIGIDLDNTLASYDSVFHQTACALGLIDPNLTCDKSLVKQHVTSKHGERSWMTLQGLVYGRYTNRATTFNGVDGFLRRARHEGVTIYIVSHKTKFGHYDTDMIDLREAALRWMDDMSFFDTSIYALSRERVFFEDTQELKVARIVCLKLDYFIDDLMEVLRHAHFPKKTKGLWFKGLTDLETGLVVCKDWEEISNAIFRD